MEGILIARYVATILVSSCLLVSNAFGGKNIDKQDIEMEADELEMDTEFSDNSNMDSKSDADSGQVGTDVEMTGSAVINGSVWIDGVKIHKPQSVYTSKKSGKTYRIHWGKNGNVSVTEE